MADGTMEIIINAVDSASEVFQSIISSATSMADGISDAIGQASSDFDTISENVAGFSDAVSNVDDSSLEQLADELGMSTDEVERLIASAADIGSMSAGFNEVAVAADDVENEVEEAAEAMQEFGSAGDVAAANGLLDFANSLKDGMLGAADSAGNFSDSLMRASLEAEGAGINVDEMTSAVSSLSEETGRAGSSIRESFIKATARGITDLDSFKTMMVGAGAQATLFGTDIQTMADKFSGLAFNANLMPKALKETGITMDELATAMGMTGATADEVKAKWKELDANQRAALLGMAASMNEGEDANEAYKNSWAGLQEQLDIAKGKLERVVGSVLLPVLIPAMKIASDVLDGFGSILDGLMKGPLGGLISVLAAAAGAFVIVVTGAAALRSFLAFLRLETMLETTATILNTAAKILNGEASSAGAIANLLLGESFMASAAAAWSAAAAFLAAAWPLLVIIGVIALVVAAIYEIGKAFGWWTDVSSMIDAIKDGITRLWNAFINHPDVQAAISMISNALSTLWGWIQAAGQAVLEFFGITSEGNFDIVRAIIDGVGAAWEAMTFPIRAVIGLIEWLIGGFTSMQETITGVWDAIMGVIGPYINQIVGFIMSLIGVFDQFKAGQMSLPSFIITILSMLWNAYVNVVSQILGLVLRFGSQLLSRAVTAGRNFLNGVMNQVRQLPNRMLSALLSVISAIVSAGSQWVSNAKSKAQEIVSGVSNVLSGTANAVASALSGVVDAIVKPFRDAYNQAKQWWDQITSLGGARGGDSAYGGDLAYGSDLLTGDEISVLHESEPIEVNENINVSLSLKDVPAGMDERLLLETLNSKDFIQAFVSNPVFQDTDARVKRNINLRYGRARGV